MKNKDMFRLLQETSVDEMPYIFVPSYKRPEFAFGQTVLCNFSSEALKKVFIFVREKQYKLYKKYNPGLQFEVIPDGAVTNIGTTRNYLLQFAIDSRIPRIIDIDDDITHIHYIYNKKNARGEVISKHSCYARWEKEYPETPQLCLQLAGRIAKEVFHDHPEVVLGNIRKQRFSNHRACGETKYQINKGPTPRQVNIINVKQCYKNGIWIPEDFCRHGSDIGFNANVLQMGFSCFNIPCLCYDYISEKVDSVVRDPNDEEANRWLHKMTYDNLQKWEIKDYLRETIKYEDGLFKYGDVDWRRYHKLHGTEPIVVKWRKEDLI